MTLDIPPGFRLLLDMDGPLAAFDDHFWRAVIAEGWPVDVPGPDGQTHRYASDHVIDPDHRAASRALVEAPGWFRALPVTAGAQAGVEELLRAGIEIVVCTKPLEENPTCRDEKAAWLVEHFPDLAVDVVITPDKSWVHGTVLLDDAIKLSWIPEATWAPVVFTAPFNGPGSPWARYQRWTWGDPIEHLIGGPRG